MNVRKTILALIWLLLLAVTVAVLFWQNEWRYSLPTPVPSNYVAVNTGTTISTGLPVAQNGKPVFLHFFNPDCPCSRFNMPHFRSLVNEYGNAANFAVVVMSNKNYSAEQVQRRYELSIPVYFDSSLASRCGVYSTPQAVILDANSKLFYRGNYNRNRYCTDKKTNYAQQALAALLHRDAAPVFNAFALKAYGCSLPQCTQK